MRRRTFRSGAGLLTLCAGARDTAPYLQGRHEKVEHWHIDYFQTTKEEELAKAQPLPEQESRTGSPRGWR